MSDGGELQAVLFDMDGLLIDSERLWLEVETEIMRWLGGTWGPEQQKDLVGSSLDVAAAFMLDLTGADASPDEVRQRMLEGMAERLSVGVPMMPGAKELLVQVRDAGVPAALVSSSHRMLVDPALDAVGREFFALSVAGDEVTHTKPHPEPYLTAVQRLGAVPGRCVVLEDSPTGVAAAEAAGCATIAVPCLLPVPPAPGRTVVESLRDLDLPRLRLIVGGDPHAPGPG